jgi:hypothetical protein
VRKILLVFLLSATTAFAKPSSPPLGDGWDPGAGKKPPTNSSGGAVFQTGPTYGAGDERSSGAPTADQVPGMINAGAPDSPNEIAAQDLGAQGNCDKSAQGQYNSLLSQLQALEAKIQAEANAEAACGGTALQRAACVTTHANNAIVYGNQALALAPQIEAAAAAAAQAAQNCQGNSATSSQAQATVPAMSWAALAARYGIPVKGGPESGAFNEGSAFQQLQTLAQEGEFADFDGRGEGMGQALNDYENAAGRALQMGPNVEAGRQLAGTDTDYSNPAEAAQEEYLKINYKELGPKYDELAAGRSTAANNVADQALATVSAPAPLPDDQGAPEVPSVDAGAPSLLDQAVDAGQEKLTDYVKDKAIDAFASLDPDKEAMEKTIGIADSVLTGTRNMLDGVVAAAWETAGTQYTGATDQLLQTMDADHHTEGEKAKDGFKYVTGLSGSDE